MAHSFQQTYRSRKEIKYDDSDSQEEDEPIVSQRSLKSPQSLSETDPNAMLKSNAQFKNYRQIFDDMLKESRIMTEFPILTCMISYDSKRTVQVQKKGEREYRIQMFDLESYEMTFDEAVGGQETDYIKIKDIE